MLPVAEEDVKTTFPPIQNMIGPFADIVGVVGKALTVTLIVVDVLEQVPFETVTVYAPAVDTVIACVVAPVDQVFPVGEDEVNTTELP